MSDWVSEETWRKAVKMAHNQFRHAVNDPACTTKRVEKMRSKIDRIYLAGRPEWQQGLGDPLALDFNGLTWLRFASEA